MLKKITFIVLFLGNFAQAQAPEKWNSNEIYEHIQKLNFLGKVLYVAAHPDDENTRLITYLSNHYHAETAYLSLTRGDGGQNLIGSELREKLGVIRTQELLEARKIDGGIQFFSRANDFGFSKNPDETFAVWNKKEVLEDVLQVFDTFQPDIVINRFDHRTPGTTHGHHTASAVLSLEAYNLAKIKPKRMFFNTSWWFYGSEEKFAKADKSKLISFNANVFYPLKGKSNHEIAALSRSQHRSQGFGTTGTRGDENEYLELLIGSLPPADNLFNGIDTSWNRIKGGKEIGTVLNKIEKHFDFKNPSSHLPDLLKAYKLIQNLENEDWKHTKTKQILAIIEACSGLYLEAVSNVETVSRESQFDVKFEVVNRSNSTVKLLSVTVFGEEEYAQNYLYNTTLANNQKFSQTETIFTNKTIPFSTLFWLEDEENRSVGMYSVEDKKLRNLPEINTPYPVVFHLQIGTETLNITKNLVYKTNKPDLGEVYLPFKIVPELTIELPEKVVVFKKGETKDFQVTITAQKEISERIIFLREVVEGWEFKIDKNETSLSYLGENETKTFTVKITAPNSENTIFFHPAAAIEKLYGEQGFNTEVVEINYPHIPKQMFSNTPVKAKFICLDIVTKKKNIGYIMGAGDEVGDYLKNLYNVTFLKPSDLEPEILKQFDAVLLGVRAFNVVNELKTKNKILFDYVHNGGNLIVQYNTNGNLVTKEIAPFELSLSRERVTDEKSRVVFLQPNHDVLNVPNKITKSDFDNWVQERGLYFPAKWDNAFIPIFSMHDKNEKQPESSLLIAKYGKGNYIYTGLSFFRQLPEGVSGAYKLLVNLIELN